MLLEETLLGTDAFVHPNRRMLYVGDLDVRREVFQQVKSSSSPQAFDDWKTRKHMLARRLRASSVLLGEHLWLRYTCKLAHTGRLSLPSDTTLLIRCSL